MWLSCLSVLSYGLGWAKSIAVVDGMVIHFSDVFTDACTFLTTLAKDVTTRQLWDVCCSAQVMTQWAVVWRSCKWEGSLLVSEKCTTPCNMEEQATWEQYNKLKHYAWLPCRGYWLGRVHCSCQWMLIQSNDVLTFAWALATCVLQPGSCGMSDMCRAVHNRLQ